jgi:putative peptide zinc metalloprotease protein
MASLSDQALGELAGALSEENYPAGAAVVKEGEPGDRLFLIVDGRAEVSTAGPRGPLALAELAVGSVFGEMALVLPGGRREATVVALTPLHLLSLDALTFGELLRSYPAARAAFEAEAEMLLVANFLRRASPLTSLGAEQHRELARRVERLSVPAGETIIRQDDLGNTCYLLQRGSVEVWLAAGDGTERRLAVLQPGALFGEMALLTEAPRSASVRAAERCKLLVLQRADLLAVIRQDRALRDELFRMVHRRARPRQAEGIVVQHRETPEGETFTILHHAERGTYYRLSPQGWFVWQRLDGRRAVRDLVLEAFVAYGSFNPEAIGTLLAGLMRAGFVVSPGLRADVSRQPARGEWWRAPLLARRLLEWRVELRGVDRLITQLYTSGGRLLFTRPALVLLALVTVAGVPLFLAQTEPVSAATAAGDTGPLLILILLLGQFALFAAHELAHALTVKAFGHEVRGAGVGWYWFSPMAFVDSSDMWLAGRWPRIAVSLAGPAASLLLGSLAAMAGLLATDALALAVLWELALISYMVGIFNLNPLFESDGYYVLTDWLDRPNLRRNALAWLGTALPRLRSNPGVLRGHRLELLYALASLLFFVVMIGLTLIGNRALLQGWLAHTIPQTLAASVGWVLVLLFVGLASAGIAADLRGERETAGGTI